MKSNNFYYFYFINVYPMVKTSFHNRHIHAISHNCNSLCNSEIFVLIFNFSPQLVFFFFFTLSLETAVHIHLPISKRTIKKMSPYDMHFIAYCKHYAENNPEYSFKTSILAIIKQFTIWNPPGLKWIMNSDILKHALQSWPAHENI